jgi:hypothetical protein
VVLAAEIVLIVLGFGIAVTAVRWIRSRPPEDPALDRVLLLVAPLCGSSSEIADNTRQPAARL